MFAQFSSSRDGSAISGLQVANGLREYGWCTRVAFGHPGPMEQVYSAQGHETIVVPHKNWLRRDGFLHSLKDWIQEFRNASVFERQMEDFRPDLVYVNTAASLAAVLAARRRGLPVLWHLRELFDDVGGELRCPPVTRPLVKRIFGSLATRLVTNSEAVRENLLRSDDQSRAAVIPNAVEEDYFEILQNQATARMELGLPTKARIIGLPGTLRPAKGHEFFLLAMTPILQESPERLLVITGEGAASYESRLFEIVREEGIDQQVRFLGSLPGLRTFFAACDLICIPSRSESFGRVAIEAMAAGKPVIASSVGGLREVIEHGKTGLLNSYGILGPWRKAVRELLLDRSLSWSLGTAGRRAARSRYSEESLRQAIGSIVADMVIDEPQRLGRSPGP